MKNLYLTVLIIIIFNFWAYAQVPAIQWQKSLGGTNFDQCNDIRLTSDGGFIVAGETSSNNGDVTGNHGGSDFWIVKLDASGSIQWQKCLGGSGDEWANAIMQTADGGYIAVGASDSNNGDVTGNNGGYSDFWVVKLNASGNIQWQKCLGGSSADIAHAVDQTIDGGYIITGYTRSNDSDVTVHHGSLLLPDYWVVKIDASGTIQWQKSLGGNAWETATSISQTEEGGYIVAGASLSLDGDVSSNHGGSNTGDFWVVKLDSAGGIQWNKCYGGTGDEAANVIEQTSDKGYIIAGSSESNDGDCTDNNGLRDYWIIKTDSLGSIQWQKSLGGSSNDYVVGLDQTNDGGYIISGWTWSNDDDVLFNHSSTNDKADYWIIKFDAAGGVEWQKSLGGTDQDYASNIQQTADGGYVVGGYSVCNDGDVSGNHGGTYLEDYWIVKLAMPAGILENSTTSNYRIYPNPASAFIKIETNNNETIGTIYTITDQLGRRRLSGLCSDKSMTIDISPLNDGTYFLQIDKKAPVKIIKQ